ncbi:MAG: DegQ family serine endoprotease [Candidatus Rhabdochlamydia sp.]
MSRFSLFTASFLLLLTPAIASTDSTPPCELNAKSYSKVFTDVAKTATPATVFLRVEVNASEDEGARYANPYWEHGEDFLDRFFGIPPGSRQPQPQVGQGSGFLVSDDGYIMTNNHVVKGADKIEVTLNDGQIREAKMIGTDPRTDLAIIKIEKIDNQNYPFLTLGDSETLEVGEWVIAIGNPFQLHATVTVGVVSATGRQGLRITDQEDFIQTDAAINPGNSGGPLINLEGKVIGINTAIASRSGGYMGIGFAIPSNMASHVMNQLMQKGSVTRGFLGVTPQSVDKEIAAGFNLPKAEGVLIASVEKNSPAEKGGILQGDIILELNQKPIKSLETFRNQISMMDPGSEVRLKIFRKGKTLSLTITLGSLSEDSAAPAVVSKKLGLEVENLSTDIARQLGYSVGEEGVVITKVRPGSPAALAGLRPGYVIQAINHKKISNTSDYEQLMAENSANKRIVLLAKHGKLSRFYAIRVE